MQHVVAYVVACDVNVMACDVNVLAGDKLGSPNSHRQPFNAAACELAQGFVPVTGMYEAITYHYFITLTVEPLQGTASQKDILMLHLYSPRRFGP